MQAIDVDRGVMMRQTVKFDKDNPNKFMPDARYGGIVVYMYKDEPGEYYDVHGNKLPEGVAKLAGFETGKYAKLKAKRRAMQQFEEKLRKELELESSEEEVILAEAGDWKVVQLPMGRAKVIDKTTGALVTAVPMGEGEAMVFLQMLTDSEAESKMEHEAGQSAKKGA